MRQGDLPRLVRDQQQRLERALQRRRAESDLDLIYLFTGDHLAESDGPRPLGGTIYYNRLASRVSAALSVPTAQGALYEVDTRLRPQGNQGPLAVSCAAFGKYQREAAWTWEHMALARARVLYGSPQARAELEDVLAEEIIKGELQEGDQIMLDFDTDNNTLKPTVTKASAPSPKSKKKKEEN